MEKKSKEEEADILRAFVTGYTRTLLRQNKLSKALIKRFPYIKRVQFPNNKPWQGYAFVDFEKNSDFLEFISKKRIRIEEFTMNLVIKPHKKGKELKKMLKEVRKRKLKILNIPISWDDFILEATFAEFGPIENCYIKKKSKGSGFLEGVVIFQTQDVASRCFLQQKIYIDSQNFVIAKYEDQEYEKSIKEKKMISSNPPVFEGSFNEEILKKRKKRVILRNGMIKDLFRKKGNTSYCLELELDCHQVKPTSVKYHQELQLTVFEVGDFFVENYRLNKFGFIY